MRVLRPSLLLLIVLACGCGGSDSKPAPSSQREQEETPRLATDSTGVGDAVAEYLPDDSRSVADAEDDWPQEPQVSSPAPADRSQPPPLLAPESLRPDTTLPRTALAPQSIESRSLAPPAVPQRFDIVRVFYGTDRAQTGSSHIKNMYGTGQGPVTYGHCDVSIPKSHKKGRLESPSIWRWEFREDPKKHVVLLDVRQQGQTELMCAIRRSVWNSMEVASTPHGPALVGGEVFVFVHGFNNTFEDAARRTAQIAHDLKFKGAPVMYSWPSQGKTSLEAYREDGQMAGWSEEHLIEFVTQVARDSGARRVHLIAHSMGNRIVSAALSRLVHECQTQQIPRFNEVILSAPDIDADYFKTAIAPYITQTAQRITIYSSSRDVALKLSSLFNPRARKRLGESGDELTLFPEFKNIDVIDATDVATDLFALNHSYLADSPTVLNDVARLLAGQTAEQRGLASMLGRLAWRIRGVGRELSDNLSGTRR